MEVMLGALPSLIPKLGDLLTHEYNLQKEVKGGVRFLQAELETMKAALEDISNTPPDQLPNLDKIWARNVRELSYDIEDNIDTFLVRVKGCNHPAEKHSIQKFIDKTLGFLMQPKIRRKMATDIRDIKSRVVEVHERRRRYEVNHSVDKPVKVDSRALVRYEKVTKLVGIEESRDELIRVLTDEDNKVSKEKDKIVSIVGFGGLGKTTLANVVYEKLRPRFDCSAFVSVSQTPNMNTLFKDMFYQLAKYNTPSINVIDDLQRFLRDKRYLVIIDDIWEFSYWKMIRCALPDDNVEYRIITTTRNIKVAKEIGSPYQIKPLSLENSRILMYGRIFGKEDTDKCPNEQLEEVSSRIIKKCDGVPLVIITIASLLASKGTNKLEWCDVCNSIGAGLKENNTLENIRNVLLLSYYDMPSYLRTCLLYLSMFPEDYDIRKDRLIWLWIAEGFIQCEKRDKSLFELGESYLSELINRSMIQLKYKSSGMVYYCRIHDMVLDLIRSLSSEENFITVWNNVGHSSTSGTNRRLSLQNGNASHGKLNATLSMEHVRSFVVFPFAIDHIPGLENFRVLRVLDLEKCKLFQGYSLEYLRNLLHLRYLGLRGTSIDHLPEGIGNLQFLQTLDVQGFEYRDAITTLPPTIVHLTHLMCLRIDVGTRVPKGFRSLAALEELNRLSIDGDAITDILEDLGHLTELKVLDIESSGKKWNSDSDESLVECLNKLQKIQSLCIDVRYGGCNLDGWMVTTRHLRRLTIFGCYLSRLPPWLNSSLLLDLSVLRITVRTLKQEDIRILGMLPALHHLHLSVDHEDLEIHGSFTISASWFSTLVDCWLWGFGGPVVFQEGAMPSLTNLQMKVPMQKLREINRGFDWDLRNLLALQQLSVRLQCGGASMEKMEEAKVAVKHAIEAHPNHLTSKITCE